MTKRKDFNFYHFCVLIIISLIYSGCSKDEVITISFPETIELNSVPVMEIDTYFRSHVSINVVDTFLVIANQQEPFVHIYSTITHDKLYTFGKQGNGPNEFQDAEVTNQDTFQFEEGINRNTATIFDFQRNHLTVLDIQASILQKEDVSINMRIPSDRNHITMLHYAGPEKIIFTPLNNANLIYYNNLNSTYNYVPFLPKSELNIKEHNKSHIYRPAVFYNTDKSLTAVAPINFGRLDFFNGEGSYLNSTVFEVNSKADSELEGDLSELKNAKFYIVELDTLKNNILALNMNTRTEDIDSMRQNHNLQLYDWDGNPLVKYELDGIALTSFAVDHKHLRVYAYAPFNEHNIIMYEL